MAKEEEREQEKEKEEEQEEEEREEEQEEENHEGNVYMTERKLPSRIRWGTCGHLSRSLVIRDQSSSSPQHFHLVIRNILINKYTNKRTSNFKQTTPAPPFFFTNTILDFPCTFFPHFPIFRFLLPLFCFFTFPFFCTFSRLFLLLSVLFYSLLFPRLSLSTQHTIPLCLPAFDDSCSASCSVTEIFTPKHPK